MLIREWSVGRGVITLTAARNRSVLGDCEVGLLALRDGARGPELTFSVGWEFVSVWDERHCCAVLDRALLRYCLPSGVETSWTVDELTWWSSAAATSSGDVVLVGLSGRRDLAGDASAVREPAWWRVSPAGLSSLRRRV